VTNCKYLAYLKAEPKGSMTEGYIAQECITFAQDTLKL